MTATINRGSLLGALLVLAVMSAQAGVSSKLDGRRLFTPSTTPRVQATTFVNTVDLQRRVASVLTTERPAELEIANFPIPGMADATLQLHRTHDVFDANTQFVHHGKGGAINLRILPIISYSGTVNGDPNSRVSLHYSDDAMVGFIVLADGNRLVVSPEFGVPQSAASVPHVVGYESLLDAQDPLENFVCGTNEILSEESSHADDVNSGANAKMGDEVQNNYLKQINVAVVIQETLYEYIVATYAYSPTQVAQYIAKVFACVSQAYEQDLNVVVHVTDYKSFSEESPSGYNNNGDDPAGLLGEFARDMASRPNDPPRTLAHIMTKLPENRGGVAGVGYGAEMRSNLCNPANPNSGSYSVSSLRARVNQELPGPAAVNNGFMWDVFVVAHEMGHNVGARHTHSCRWQPPIDSCVLASSDMTDACYDSETYRRVIDGTIMSYCHLRNGERTMLTFGPRASDAMKGWLSSSTCVKLVTEPTVHISSPRGTEAFMSGRTMTIKWSSQSVSNVKIEYATNLGPSTIWQTVAPSLPAMDRQYAWTVPELNASSVVIRVSDIDNPAVSDTSLAEYSFSTPLVVVEPKAGARLAAGSTTSISWIAKGVATLSIDYSPDGIEWDTIATGVKATDAVYTWTVPAQTTEQGRVRLRGNIPGSTTQSGLFAIGTRRFALLSPKEGDVICKTLATQYRWSADFLDKIRIQVSSNGGTDWKTITSSVDATSGMAFLQNNSNLKDFANGTSVILRVTLTTGGAAAPVLQTITGLTIDTCAQVTSVDESEYSTSVQIASVGINAGADQASVRVNTSGTGRISVMAVNTAGETAILAADIEVNANTTSLQLPIGALASGSYQMVVQSGSQLASAPFSVIR